MDIEEDIKIINNFIQNIENGFTISKEISSWEPEKRIAKAIDHILAEREEDKKEIEKLKEEVETHTYLIFTPIEEALKDYIAKQKVKEKLEKAEKENEPYEQYDKESRMYWINEGKISLAKELLEDK